MTTSRSDDTDRLRKLVLLLSSNQPGEVAAAAAAIGRLLTTQGQGWHDLAARLCARPAPPPPSPPSSPTSPGIVDMLDDIASRDDYWLTTWEREFVDSVTDQYRRRGRLSPKQHQHLERIWKKVA